jgi:hypothetical protein
MAAILFQKFFNFKSRIIVIIYLFSIIQFSISIAQNCGYNASPEATCRWGLPYPSCSLEGVAEKCVRIKFHFINNTTGAINSPSDLYFGYLIEEINKVYSSSKIRFTFEEECVHRFSKLLYETQMFESTQIIRSLLADENAELLPIEERDPELGYLDGYLNVYFVQQIQGLASGFRPASLVVFPIYGDFSNLIHEIGHALGLSHTHRVIPKPLNVFAKTQRPKI